MLQVPLPTSSSPAVQISTVVEPHKIKKARPVRIAQMGFPGGIRTGKIIQELVRCGLQRDKLRELFFQCVEYFGLRVWYDDALDGKIPRFSIQGPSGLSSFGIQYQSPFWSGRRQMLIRKRGEPPVDFSLNWMRSLS